MGLASVQVLLVDDDPGSALHVQRTLGDAHVPAIRVRRVRTLARAQRQLERGGVDLILLNLMQKELAGLGALAVLRAQAPLVPVVVLAPASHENLALKALQQGAHDYLITDQIYPTLLVRTLTHAVERHETAQRRDAAERALRDSEARYRALFEQSRDAILLADTERRITVVNRAATELLGFSAEELVGVSLEGLIEEQAVIDSLRNDGESGPGAPELETRLRRRTGERVWCIVSAAARRDESGAVCGYQAILHDITERKRAEARLLHNALHDSLTGLPNRVLFTDRVEMACARMQRHPAHGFALLFLDLDRFKVVNDSLGHAAGDALLVEIGVALRGCVRTGDTVARMGGDEFAILLDGIDDEEDAIATVERIQARLARPFELDGRHLFTSASIGLAYPSITDESAEELLRNADIAMYRAKSVGPGRYRVYDTDMHARAADLHALETDLRLALARNEFEMFYQTIIGLEEGRVVGVEALLRWRHPRRGLLLPQDFMHVAEESGLIVPIGWWALRQACRQASAWLDLCTGDECPVMSVNMSARQIMAPDLVERIENVLRETGLPGSALALEITESMLMSDTAVTVASLVRLRALGIQLTIDDFGTGYSSLGYLHALPIDGLKIDRSFVETLGSADDRAELIGTILSLAGRLGITAVVEGVETEAQLRQLRELGSSYMQGYLFAPPLNAERTGDLIAARLLLHGSDGHTGVSGLELEPRLAG
jgi:diguanylate cyclase (GGDEF)-like protein/PAS domain S-box-containing protein